MAPIQQFIRWLKDKTSNKNDTKVTRIRKLPPIPDVYDYGFRRHDDATSHIYEEIIYDVPTIDTDGNEGSSGTTLDFDEAESVGPYLVVPIRKTASKNADMRHLDLIADLKKNDSRKVDGYQSLLNIMPDWAKEHLRSAPSKGYSVDDPPSYGFQGNRTESANHSAQSSVDSTSHLIRQLPSEDRHGNSRSQHGNARTRDGNTRKESGNGREAGSSQSRNNQYEIPSFDTRDDYEYFLIKTENNLRIEQELRNYLNGTPMSAQKPSTSNERATRNVLLIAKREKSPKKKQESRRPNVKKCKNPKERYQRAADALLDQIYSAPSNPTGNIVPSRRIEVERTKTDAKFKNSSMDESKLSCRVTNFELEPKKPRVKTPHPKTGQSSNLSFDSSSSDSIYDPADGDTNQFLCDIMRQNHDRQLSNH